MSVTITVPDSTVGRLRPLMVRMEQVTRNTGWAFRPKHLDALQRIIDELEKVRAARVPPPQEAAK